MPFLVATPEDLERGRLSDLTYNLIESDIIKDIQQGIYIAVHDAEKCESMVELVQVFGFTKDMISLEEGFDSNNPTLINRVAWSIKKKTFSHQFLIDWGNLKYFQATYIELYLRNLEVYRRDFHHRMKSIGENRIIQYHWFAHWVNKNALKKIIPVESAISSILELLIEISEGRKNPWGPYPREWFDAMLEIKIISPTKPKDKTYDMKSPYLRFSKADIRRMVAHPLITTQVVPPLSAGKFRLA